MREGPEDGTHPFEIAQVRGVGLPQDSTDLRSNRIERYRAVLGEHFGRMSPEKSGGNGAFGCTEAEEVAEDGCGCPDGRSANVFLPCDEASDNYANHYLHIDPVRAALADMRPNPSRGETVVSVEEVVDMQIPRQSAP